MITHAILEISDFKQVERADIPPVDGYTLDGHIEHRYDAEFAARAAGVELLKKFSVLQIKIYVAATKTEALLK
jgi:hypothetical protein